MTTAEHQFLKASVVNQVVTRLIPRGQIFTVTFVKDNGEVRVMNCRRGVYKNLNDHERRERRSNPSVLTVFDLKENAYRSFHVDKVLKIKARGMLIQVADEE